MTDLAYLHQQRDLAQIAAESVLLGARDDGRNTLTPDEDAAYRAHMRNMRALGTQILDQYPDEAST